jgi:hypothetical protein
MIKKVAMKIGFRTFIIFFFLNRKLLNNYNIHLEGNERLEYSYILWMSDEEKKNWGREG